VNPAVNPAAIWSSASFRAKLLASLLVLTLGVTVTLVSLVWFDVRNLPTDVVRALLLAKLGEGQHLIDPADVAELEAHYSQTSPPFLRLQRALKIITEAGREADGFGREMRYGVYLFATTPDPNRALQLVTLNPADTGTLYDLTPVPSMRNGWRELTVETTPSADAYGVSLSGYVPIKDASGTTLALLGIDVSASEIALNQRKLFAIMGSGALFAMLGSAVCAFLLARLLNRPVAVLHGGMTRVADGDLTVALPVPRARDEFAALNSQFNRMVVGLRERQELKRSLELAAQIQGHLLPKIAPTVVNFDLFAGADYCDETGGDYYDFIKLASGDIGLVVADVAGHGIASALVMASARGVLRSCADAAANDPGMLLRAVNAHLCQDVDVQKFVTMFYGVLRPATGEVTWSSAGHDEAILLRADGTVETLGTTGTPLSIIDDEPYPSEGPVTLRPGDLLAIPTDGIREARNPRGEFFDGERFLELLRDNHSKPAADIHAAILHAVHEFRTHAIHQQDDITLMIVKAGGGGS
jgi:serine phosphatase RsbU (regulator of sigma subunit)